MPQWSPEGFFFCIVEIRTTTFLLSGTAAWSLPSFVEVEATRDVSATWERNHTGVCTALSTRPIAFPVFFCAQLCQQCRTIY